MSCNKSDKEHKIDEDLMQIEKELAQHGITDFVFDCNTIFQKNHICIPYKDESVLIMDKLSDVKCKQ